MVFLMAQNEDKMFTFTQSRRTTLDGHDIIVADANMTSDYSAAMSMIIRGRYLSQPVVQFPDNTVLTPNCMFSFESTQTFNGISAILHTGLGLCHNVLEPEIRQQSSNARSSQNCSFGQLFGVGGVLTVVFMDLHALSSGSSGAFFTPIAGSIQYGTPMYLSSRSGYLTLQPTGNDRGKLIMTAQKKTVWKIFPGTAAYQCLHGGYCIQHEPDPGFFQEHEGVYFSLDECVEACQEDSEDNNN
jgi:hypothetical protein